MQKIFLPRTCIFLHFYIVAIIESFMLFMRYVSAKNHKSLSLAVFSLLKFFVKAAIVIEYLTKFCLILWRPPRLRILKTLKQA